MAKELIQRRIQRLRESLGLDRHQFAARIHLSYTAVWNWETKGTETFCVPEDRSLKAIVAEFHQSCGVTLEWLKTGGGDEPAFGRPTNPPQKSQPDRQQVLEGIRELEKLPEVAAYLALRRSLGDGRIAD